MQENYVLELKNISKSFTAGVKALDNVHINVKAGSVHALMGENGAGKSTLIKIINGIYSMDEGEIKYLGKVIKPQNPKQMLEMGVATIHQELSPIDEMTIAENIWLGREPKTKLGSVDYKKMYDETQKIIDSFGFKYKAKQKVGTLSISDMQLVEMMKAVSRDAKLVIMDEPTSSITETESKVLFKCIEDLKSKGVSIIYISHKMEEVFDICDELTVFRDGKWIISCGINEIDHDKVIECMVGRELKEAYPSRQAKIGDVSLELKGLSKEGVFSDVDLKVREGEILGIAGLVGAGRTELFRTVFGLDKYDKGEICVKGQEIKIRNVQDAIKNKIVMTPEDRKNEGLVLCRSILENTSLEIIEECVKGGAIQSNTEKTRAVNMLNQFSIKMSSPNARCESLSGGNQQKVVLAKWMLSDPKILVLDEPTRGIDVGAKFEIYKFICDISLKGVAVIMISSELPELLGVCDRIAVMSNGKMTGELDRSEFSQEAVMKLAMANY